MLVGMRPAAAAIVLITGACVTVPPRERGTAPQVERDSVTIAYGRVARRQLTSSVGSITEDDIATMTPQRVEQLFQGRLAGVQVLRGPRGELSIRIRGAPTLGYSSAEPLIVVDGMPTQDRGFGSVLDGIAPMDIARIDVLKDAAATAVYGVRGANGVILITTKRAGQD